MEKKKRNLRVICDYANFIKKKKSPKRHLTTLGIVKIRGIRTINGHNDFYLHLCCQRNLMNKQKVDTEAGIKGLGKPEVVQKRQG